LIGLSANSLLSHEKWIEDINDVTNSHLTFPIIADQSRRVAYLYDMIDYQDTTNIDSKGMALTIRAVYFIDPKKIIRAIIYYPASTGRNSQEVLRVIDSLQLGDKHKVVTPIDWKVCPLENKLVLI
jgi:glutaredoxin/glutathione-dependent peroxiredoxin